MRKSPPPFTKEHRAKIGSSMKRIGMIPPDHSGKKRSTETRLKMSLAMRGKKKSEEHKQKLREANVGHQHTLATRKKMSDSKKGIRFSEEHKKSMRGRTGSKSGGWKGGVSKPNELFRKSLEYKLWRTAVFDRDNYQCIWGGKEHGNKLHADHIKPFCLYPELRLAIDNGRTLCVSCHRTTDTFGNRPKLKESYQK